MSWARANKIETTIGTHLVSTVLKYANNSKRLLLHCLVEVVYRWSPHSTVVSKSLSMYTNFNLIRTRVLGIILFLNFDQRNTISERIRTKSSSRYQ